MNTTQSISTWLLQSAFAVIVLTGCDDKQPPGPVQQQAQETVDQAGRTLDAVENKARIEAESLRQNAEAARQATLLLMRDAAVRAEVRQNALDRTGRAVEQFGQGIREAGTP